MPIPEAVAAIARRHRVDPAAVAAAPVQGAANLVYFLGEALVLRIARPETAEDLRKEAVVIPAAVRAGVRTPALVDFDDGGGLLEVPYMLVERAPGVTPGRSADDRWRPAYRELGAELAALHADVDAPPGVPDEAAADAVSEKD